MTPYKALPKDISVKSGEEVNYRSIEKEADKNGQMTISTTQKGIESTCASLFLSSK